MKKYLSLILVLVMILCSMSVMASADEITEFHDYQTTSNEMETFCYLYTQKSADLNVLSNCYDHLLTNDPQGALVPCAAKEYYTEDGGMTWTFKLNEGMTWVDYQGNYKADVVAQDFLTGLEWVLNYHKNAAANSSMPIQMIKGAGEYYEYTKALPEEEGKALGLDKLTEMVGIAAPDDYTVVYTCLDKLAYFPTLTCYNCLAPISAKMIEEIGVDGFFGASYDTLWYNGPYTITYYVQGNEKTLTKNPSYWNKDNVKLFDAVNIKMVDSVDVAFQLFQNGELDYVELSESMINTINNNASNEFNKNLVPTRPTKFSYNWKWNYAKNKEDGTPDDNWNKAVANEAFRKSIYWGLDMGMYLARINTIDPLSCQNYGYTMPNLVTNSEGVEYSQMVLNELGMAYDYSTYSRYDAEKAAAYKAQAIEELTAQGVTFPVELDWYIAGDNQVSKDTADVLTQMFNQSLGEDYIKFTTKTYVTKYMTEVVNPRLHSIWSSGWGADYGDPVNFLGQEIANDDNAYYAMKYCFVNDITDETLKATYQEFTDMVNAAHAITDDLDARYAAFAKAEAYFVDHALCIPTYFNKTWQLTCVNDYSKIYSLYGVQSQRYVNWETNDGIYTKDEYAELTK